MRVAYINGREEQLKLLLIRAIRRASAHDGLLRILCRARTERITTISEHLAHLELLTEKIGAQTQKLQVLEAENAREVRHWQGRGIVAS